MQQPEQGVSDRFQSPETELVRVDGGSANLPGDGPDLVAVVPVEVAPADQGGGVIIGLRRVEDVPSGVSGFIDVGEQRRAGFSHGFLFSVLRGA